MGKIIGLTFPAAPAAKEKQAEKLVCPHCGKEYKSAEGLEKHIADKHPASEASEPDEPAPDEPAEASEADGEAPADGEE